MLGAQQVRSDPQTPTQSSKTRGSDTDSWDSVVARDHRSDGIFVFGVRTTGIYCRPSCPAKHPNRENVVFFGGPDEAEHDGFRPCKRCNPRQAGASPESDLVQRVCAYINANLDEKLTLTSLGRVIGFSPFHLQRTFKRKLGLSPREYLEARRLEKLKRSLTRGETVTNALYEAGFTSRSRLYEKSVRRLGVNPGTFRRGGGGLQIQYTILNSPIGRLLLGATDKGICAVCMGASDEAVEAALKEDYFAADFYRDDDAMKSWALEFSRYFDGQEFPRNLPIDVQATTFQWKVWKQIQNTPYGKTVSYSKIAQSLKNPRSVRAVANACASNRVALLIPCHRVVGKSGELRGYRWGTERKQTLLSLEKDPQRPAIESSSASD